MRNLLSTKAAELSGLVGHRGFRILKTGGWALFAKLCAALNLFLCVPFVLDALGQRHFGAWAAIVSIITLSNFLDFGLGNGAMNLVAGAKGRKATDEIAGIVRIAYASLLKITGILSIGLLAIPFIAWHKLLGLPVSDANISTISVAVVVLAVLATIPLSLANKLQLGLGIGGNAFRWQALGQLLTTVVVIALAKTGANLPMLVAASALVPITALMLNTMQFRGTLPESSCVPTADTTISRQIRNEGLLFFVLQLCAALAYSFDLLLITSLSSPEQAANYSIVQRAFSLIPLSLGLIWVSLWPSYREALASGHQDWAFRIFKKATALAAAYAFCAGIFIAFYFEPISKVWLGHSLQASAFLIWGFAIWHIAEAIGTSTAMFLNAASIVRIQIAVALAFALPCLFVKTALATNHLSDFLPLATVSLYLTLNLLPLAFAKGRIMQMITNTKY